MEFQDEYGRIRAKPNVPVLTNETRNALRKQISTKIPPKKLRKLYDKIENGALYEALTSQLRDKHWIT